MDCTIERVRQGDEQILADIHIASWKAGFGDILNTELLRAHTRPEQVSALYRRLLKDQIGRGFLLKVGGSPHCIAWWDASRETDMYGYAELICIHSLTDRWRMGYGRRMMDAVLGDMADEGYSNVMLWVFEENVRAREFYHRLGFIQNGKRKNNKGAPEICLEMTL